MIHGFFLLAGVFMVIWGVVICVMLITVSIKTGKAIWLVTIPGVLVIALLAVDFVCNVFHLPRHITPTRGRSSTALTGHSVSQLFRSCWRSFMSRGERSGTTVLLPIESRNNNSMIEIKHKKTGAVIVSLDVPSLAKANLSGLDLTGAGLRDRFLFNTNIAETNLTGADLTGARLPYVNLHGANLHRAALRGTEVSQADFSDADLSEVNLTRAVLFATNLEGANVGGLRLSYSHISYCSFEGKDMASVLCKHADFSKVKLGNTDLGGSRLIEVRFHQCDMRETRLVGAILKSVIWQDCDLEGLDFTAATLQSVCFINCRNLHLALGLESVIHKAPRSWQGASSLDVATVRSSLSHLPDSFLWGLGYSQDEIMGWRGIYANPNRLRTEP